MKPKSRSNKLFRKWLLIQFCFLAFMTAVTAGVYFYTNHHIKRQIDELYISNLERTEAEVDSVFQYAAATVNEYNIQPRVRMLSGLDLSDSERDVARLIDDIKQTNSTAKGISEIIIYFKNQDVFISSAGVMDRKIFCDVYSSSTGDERISIIDAISDETLADTIVPVNNGRNGTNTAIYSEEAVDNIFISAVIDAVQIEDILNANLQSERNAFCVFAGNELIFAHGSDIQNELYKSVGLGDFDQFQKVKSSNTEYVYLASDDNDIKYVSLINEDNYFAGKYRIQSIAIIILSVSILLGAGISYYITRYKYKPVETVINVSKAITPSHVFASDDNELEQIKGAIEFIYEQKMQTKAVLEEHNIYIKENAIKMLLDGDIRYQDITEHVKSLIDIDQYKAYCVAVIDDEKYLNTYREDQQTNIFLSKAKHVISKGGRVIAVFESKADEVVAILNKQITEISIDGTIAVGMECIGHEGIKTSYDHALLGLSRKILPDTPRVIPPLSSREAGAITISTENEIRLGGFIQSGDTDKALAMLKELAGEHGINNLNYFSFKTYLYNISNIIIRSAENVLSEDTLRKLLEDFNSAFKQEDYQSISKALIDSTQYVTVRYREKMNSSNKNLNASLVKYIENKISEPQLSSDMIAEAMRLNSAYLRRFFKEQNGITLWDFINMKRIETAKNKLITTDLSIKNISLTCGYVSISTFVRTFKKFSGMTPGHYRNLYR